MIYPNLSVVIATLNSQKSLSLVLASIIKQEYPKQKLEIIVVDGGSTDNTVNIAKRYRCKILKNSKVDQVYAKHLGYLKARGEYLLLIDSDEVLENTRSVKLKCLSMMKNDRVKVVISSGLKKPLLYSQINNYINEFGDPFSYFMYRISKDPMFFLKELSQKYRKYYEDKDRVLFDFSESTDPPFIELTAMAVMINLKYVRSSFPRVLTDTALHTHIFYLLNTKPNLFAVMKRDSVLHYSADTLKWYLRKIESRVKNNIYLTTMGQAGYKGREDFQPKYYNIKKFLFIPYSLSFIFPSIDSIRLVITRRRLVYLIHPILCIYTTWLIVYYYTLRLFNIRPKLHGYGTK